MRRVDPKVFLVAETRMLNPAEEPHGIEAYLKWLGTAWRPYHVGDPHVSDGELLVEVMGRLCYRSWEPGMNPNVTKIREGNREYLANIIKSGHGSVLEHATMSFVFADVSRVFTHELVRHRAGMAFSQESLRYVRLTDLGLWLPPEIEDPHLVRLFETTFRDLEAVQRAMAEEFGLDDEKSFARKKKLTSAMRRLAPIGLATSIGATFNARSLRHVIEMRTAESAESEMKYVAGKLAAIAAARWPNLFQDFGKNEKGEWVPGKSKI